MKIDHQLFKEEIYKRKIEYLIHFTPTINLYSILEQKAILSREIIERSDVAVTDVLDYVQFTDDHRFDNQHYINLSISGPNAFLFPRFRAKTQEDAFITWCVLKIDPKHIYDVDTLFSVTNAASNAAKHTFKITGDLDKFKMMFSDNLFWKAYNGTRTHSRTRLKSQFTTDTQAEVLVKDKVPYESILEVCFENEEDMVSAKFAMDEQPTDKFVVDPEIFNPSRMI